MAGTVFVNKINDQRVVPSMVRRALDGRLNVVLVDGLVPPNGWDYYYLTSRLSRSAESAAAKMSATLICLPEAGEYLSAQVMAKVAAGQDVWIYQPRYPGDSAH